MPRLPLTEVNIEEAVRAWFALTSPVIILPQILTCSQCGTKAHVLTGHHPRSPRAVYLVEKTEYGELRVTLTWYTECSRCRAHINVPQV